MGFQEDLQKLRAKFQEAMSLNIVEGDTKEFSEALMITILSEVEKFRLNFNNQLDANKKKIEEQKKQIAELEKSNIDLEKQLNIYNGLGSLINSTLHSFFVKAGRLKEEEKRVQAEKLEKARALEAKLKADEEAKRKAEEELRLKAEAEAKKKIEEEARLKAEMEAAAKKRAEEEARLKSEMEAEAKRKAEEQARLKAEMEAATKKRAEEEARLKAEAEEQARLKAESEVVKDSLKVEEITKPKKRRTREKKEIQS